MGCGVLDTAGSSVIHMTAGCTGLVILWFLKTRRISGFTSDMLLMERTGASVHATKGPSTIGVCGS